MCSNNSTLDYYLSFYILELQGYLGKRVAWYEMLLFELRFERNILFFKYFDKVISKRFSNSDNLIGWILHLIILF